jgi:hypothetical protein
MFHDRLLPRDVGGRPAFPPSSKEARELVKNHLIRQRANIASGGCEGMAPELIKKIADVSGNPRNACWRFARQAGVVGKRTYRAWPKRAQQRLLDLVAIQPLPEVVITLHRSRSSIRSLVVVSPTSCGVLEAPLLHG